MASGPTLFDRTGIRSDLPADDPVCTLLGSYLAQRSHNLVLTVSPQRILVGGSVGGTLTPGTPA